MHAWHDNLVEHGFAPLSQVRLHYVTAGRGPLVVLLHGFPEFWFSWRHQIAVLSGAGFRVVAPDMRGYNDSEGPTSVAAYSTDLLARDVVELIGHLGESKAVVVGHDWGGYVAWWVANNHPEHVERLAVLNCPHPGHALRMMMDPAQIRRSWYILLFQLPWLPERIVARDQFAGLRKILAHNPTRRDAFTPEDIARYVNVAQKPRVISTTINYYRALLRHRSRRRLQRLDMPVQVIWGTGDRHLGVRYAVPPPDLVPRCDVRRLEGVSHWVQNDAPDRVNRLLLEFTAELLG